MSYVESVLMPNETVVKTAQIHWFIFVIDVMILLIGFWVAQTQFLLAVVIVGSGILMVLRDLIYYLTTELVLTDRRVIAKFGWIQRNTIELGLGRVESLTVNQSIAGRLFNFGTLVINGVGGIHTPIAMIMDPLSFRSQTITLLDTRNNNSK